MSITRASVARDDAGARAAAAAAATSSDDPLRAFRSTVGNTAAEAGGTVDACAFTELLLAS